MNLKQLLFAQTVAQTQSFSRAAELCHATQPTLSNGISQLEDELGGKLFVRTTRKVGLTAFGEYLLPYINEVLNNRDELLKAAEAYNNPQQSLLRIGFSPLVDMSLLNQVLLPYKEAHPDVSLFFKECLLDDLSERIENEKLDFAIVPTDMAVRRVNAFPFYRDELLYIPQQDEQFESTEPVYRIDRLPDAPVIMTGGGCGLNDSLKDLFESQNSQLMPYPGQAISYPVIQEWASLGIGAGILPRAKISKDEKNTGRLQLKNGDPASFSFEWIWGAGAGNRKDLQKFVDHIKNKVPSLIKGTAKSAVA